MKYFWKLSFFHIGIDSNEKHMFFNGDYYFSSKKKALQELEIELKAKEATNLKDADIVRFTNDNIHYAKEFIFMHSCLKVNRLGRYILRKERLL